ncbi:MAG: FAD-dependent oxidoreductase, partial [Lachnospiraceae bacterium]|nr:FAD-dependent oxidoreductase [Lachnospiraceae bacterium]
IDARKKPQLFHVYTLGVTLKNKGLEEKTVKRCRNNNVLRNTQNPYRYPASGQKELTQRPVIIGMGPAGLFCGYMLAKHGYKPVLLERGFDVETRTKDVEAYWNGRSLNAESNVQFGEGGAGTFSDGKLNTLVKDKSGRNREVLRIFAEFGAPEQILYESKPHIGTDILKKVVMNLRNDILKNGGEVRFGAKVTGLEVNDGVLRAVVVNGSEVIKTTQAVLAIGHSARDTFTYLNDINVPMEAKAFAVGMRVEHPQSLINECMYGKEHGNELPAAPYKLTAQTSAGRGVYSFCMCPGGYVVNASSEPGQIAVNGMSYSDRGSGHANSAIIVQVMPEDYGADGPLAGVAFQRRLEKRAYELGKGSIPVQYYCDFAANVSSDGKHVVSYNKPCIKGAYQWTNIRGLLPLECEKAFLEGMQQFERTIPGFAGQEAILSGIESRTSSPVRIHRDEHFQSPAVQGLYPCGEGAGYAGGITSAAMDGILIAEQIITQYKPDSI